ncbi:UPF0390 protein zgc136864-like isoform X2 [Littorina saxatilis]|uniref:Uncharacterized protein n=1 Tax=Littorina saxatilis TaxID=31220 RepID=A0AAN9FXH5_9CAEN
MPQGKTKIKVQLPKGVKQKQKQQKKQVLRKGPTTIAPKKARLVEAAKWKQGLSRQLHASIEEKAVSRATSSEATSLRLLKVSTSSGSKAKSNKKK